MNILMKRSSYGFALELKKAIPRRLMDRQRARPKIISNEDRLITYNPFQALQLIKVHTFTSFT